MRLGWSLANSANPTRRLQAGEGFEPQGPATTTNHHLEDANNAIPITHEPDGSTLF